MSPPYFLIWYDTAAFGDVLPESPSNKQCRNDVFSMKRFFSESENESLCLIEVTEAQVTQKYGRWWKEITIDVWSNGNRNIVIN